MSAADLRRRSLVGAAALGMATRWASATDGSDFWRQLRLGGCVVLMRHATTEPGTGDPPGFRLGDCRTQRNLSDDGRAQARRVGQAFAAQGIAPPTVRSSAWCRCTETAQLAFGPHTVWPALNSFFQGDAGPTQTREVLQTLTRHRAPGNLVLVTHQVNISALTGEYPAMGDLFLSRPAAGGETLKVLARWRP